jgi:hypothetical protein
MGSLLRFKLGDFVGKYGLKAFVETGTARGDSLAWAAQVPGFARLLSCEIEPLLAAGAVCRFNDDARVSVVRMESGDFVELLAAAALPPAFWWLDAHYPGAGFGLRDYDAGLPEDVALPLRRELAALAKSGRTGDVILIDDLRIYEPGDYEDGPLPADTPGAPVEGGADWIRAMFAATHEAKKLLHDQGYLVLLPKREGLQ